jgi:septin family protein
MTQNDETLEVKVQEYPFTINILICGESGTGKRTFINILNNRKIAYESDNGFIKTNKINEYLISFKQEEKNFIIN